MRISLSEIWNFVDLIGKEEKGWSYTLKAAEVAIENIDQSVLFELKSDEAYDLELLPEIFTFREILWQPDVFTNAQMSLPGIRILKAYCEESAERMKASPNAVNTIYRELILGLASNCEQAASILESNAEDGVVARTLGQLRRQSFPIIKFFIYHPKNRVDYYRDALNRLNYAVKVMLTQFHRKYTELEDPYWEVSFQKTSSKKPKKEEVESDS
ncbi:MAG: hypothetical protein JXQ90_11770 [Cyclobacteriaceae bacterium]